MKHIKKAFTLVELIVVITILSILGTIAFISLQGYTADARNTKRVQNLKEITKAIEVKTAVGSILLSLITADASNKVTSWNIAGTTIATTNYDAGILNYTALWIKSDDFKDPSSNADYRIGATTLKNGEYEMAASIENGAGAKSAMVVGTYVPRLDTSITLSSAISNWLFVLDNSDINKLRTGDIIEDNASNEAKIFSISRDGKTVKFTKIGATDLSGTTIKLDNEVKGLIKGKDSSNAAGTVEDGSAFLPYP